MTTLLTHQTAKLAKTQTSKVLSCIMYLDPLASADICLGASAGCRKSCLINSGRMRMDNAVQARKARTDLYMNHREIFMLQLKGEIMQAQAKALKAGKQLDVRLNGTSDLDWSEIYEAFPGVQFHEYTKRPDLAAKIKQYPNVHVTFSKHENHSVADVKQVLFKGINVAVVFKNEVPDTWENLQVINGDTHDRRFEDELGNIVGLKLKGTNDVKDFAVRRGFAV